MQRGRIGESIVIIGLAQICHVVGLQRAARSCFLSRQILIPWNSVQTSSSQIEHRIGLDIVKRCQGGYADFLMRGSCECRLRKVGVHDYNWIFSQDSYAEMQTTAN